MKILVVTTWFPNPAAPYAGIFNFRDVQMLAESNDVTVLYLSTNAHVPSNAELPIFADNKFTIHEVHFNPRNPFAVGSIFRRIKPYLAEADAVHTMAFPSLLAFAIRRPKLPWVHTEHSSGTTVRRSGLMGFAFKKALRYLLNRPNVLVTVSDYLRERLADVRNRNVLVVGNFVRVPSRVVAPRPSKTIRIVAVGNLIPHKGPLIAVEAVAALRDAGTDVHLTWVGEGPESEGVQQRVTELNLDSHVSLVGAIGADTVSEYLNRADLFLLPTVSETYGVALAEAMAHGLPVVTGSTGGFTDFLDPASSRRVEQRTPSAYAAAILDLWNDPERPARSTIAASARAEFSEDARRRKYADAYALAGADGFDS